MVEALFNGLFNLITKLAQLLLQPFITGITALFPATETMFSYILQYLTKALTYVSAIRVFVGIPVGVITMLFDYYAIKYSIYLLKIGINFAINIYNKLKP